MTPSYTITEVGDSVREWTSQKGAPFKSYRVTLRNTEGRELANVEVSRPATSPKPEAGQTVEGTVDTSGQYGPKLKEPRPGGGGLRSKPPEERRSIAMQHAQKCAVTVLDLAATHGEFKPASVNDLAQQVKVVAGVLFAQVMEAESGRVTYTPAPSTRQVSDVPEAKPGEFEHPREKPMEMLG